MFIFFRFVPINSNYGKEYWRHGNCEQRMRSECVPHSWGNFSLSKLFTDIYVAVVVFNLILIFTDLKKINVSRLRDETVSRRVLLLNLQNSAAKRQNFAVNQSDA